VRRRVKDNVRRRQ